MEKFLLMHTQPLPWPAGGHQVLHKTKFRIRKFLPLLPKTSELSHRKPKVRRTICLRLISCFIAAIPIKQISCIYPGRCNNGIKRAMSKCKLCFLEIFFFLFFMNYSKSAVEMCFFLFLISVFWNRKY